jgi:hypothetical protein
LKKIKFIPNSEQTFNALNPPAPSKGYVPEWYKKATNFIGGKMVQEDYGINKGFKLCAPFFDSLIAGYTIELPYDVIVERQGSQVFFGWRETEKLIEPRNNAIELPRPSGHYPEMYAWVLSWGIQTPTGYSVLVTHPFNRHDLPFTTTTGIMDSDNYSQAGELPFFLNANFEGVIPAGTPIAQILPIKREPWKAEKMPYDKAWSSRQLYLIRRVTHGAYKKLFWQRKSYS